MVWVRLCAGRRARWQKSALVALDVVHRGLEAVKHTYLHVVCLFYNSRSCPVLCSNLACAYVITVL
jgi:hypothetical protein